ncbi:VOC family protein [Qipengyuania sp. XHP0207]|uniref:VOC family protein n=1 Tax=Qipengyuania sp. XHP0207 TaxID=3038078 RepID=UPI00241C6186|nr:VOC family protein [Qipengyuania sp. XHP0207]MDG5746641.1 VOC family protein [Qipengyuania sp. XHP0207]
MFNHIMIGTNDIEKSKAFYEKVLGVLGAQGAMENTTDSGTKRVFFMHDGNVFALSQPIDGEPATCANGMTIGFRCNSPEQVKELHDVAVANGGTSIEDPPGLRESTMGAMHLSYFRDLDGHKICGIHRPS